MSAAGFPRRARILTQHEFDHTFRAGQSAGSKLFRGLTTPDTEPRLGITVPKRTVPLASSRNRIKRVVREAFRQRRAQLPPRRYVVVARGDVGKADRKSLRAEVEKLLDRLAALKLAEAPGTIADPPRAESDVP